ncbi:hypothetical protein K5Q29_06950 [Streptococcus sp. 2018037]|uniref:hypothetical protein n=1 Tax=Streptococcus TaxID=1301 RepID=UPI000CF5C1B3|nr:MULTISPECIES: hypothetical protein [Streptococcus]MBM7267992.1 hypothetical protein [Streptococcus suis]MBY0753172.1 hypothetical protein [Streptococcus sp. 2018037]
MVPLASRRTSKATVTVRHFWSIRYQADPEADYFLVKLFQPEALDDRDWWFTNPPGYTVDQSVLEEFDKTFPFKEKLVLPGQLGQ